MAFLKKLQKIILNLLFPKICLLCQKEGGFLCQDCKDLFQIIDNYFCLCKNPKVLAKPGKCPFCKKKYLTALYSPLSYNDKRVRKIIHFFKYDLFLKELANPLSQFIITYLKQKKQKLKSNSVLIPLPLEKRKLKRRGFNQAQLIAEYLSSNLKTKIIKNCLIKTKDTLPQIGLSEKERRENIKGAFAIKNKKEISGKIIYLIDDIYTTGATLEEAAKVLKKAGAKQVFGIVIARAFKEN